MKLGTNSSAVEITGETGGSSNFSIAMNAKAFKVLSSTLYQNKVGSIIRELSCNAYDSHIAAKKADVPFEIHIPDEYEPWFSIRDFGVGLSPSDITTVFSVYFESTKDQSNDAIGAFGLGAKTPFSYTDQFTVTSWHGGKKYMYNACIAESGVPMIILMTEEDNINNESNGVEINIGARRDDFRTFIDEVRQQLKFFKVRPILRNYNTNTMRWLDMYADPIFSNDTFFVADVKGYDDRRRGQWIVQGQVGYQLNYDNLIGVKVDDDAMKPIISENLEFLKAFNDQILHMHFNIGEIGVTASREGIEYDKKTVKNIHLKLAEIRKQVIQHVTDQCTQSTSEWELVSFINKHPLLRKFAIASKHKFSNAERTSDGNYAFNLQKLALVKDPNKQNETIKMFSISQFDRYHDRVKDCTSNYSGIWINPTSNTKILFVYTPTGSKVAHLSDKVKQFQQDNDNGVVLVFDNVKYPTDQAMIDAITQFLGNCPYVWTNSETLSDPPKVVAQKKARAARDYSRPTYYVNNGTSTVKDWERKYEPLSDIKTLTYYIEIDDMAPIVATFSQIKGKYDRLIAALNSQYNSGHDVNYVLVGIRTNDLKKIIKNSLFVEFTKYATEFVENKKTDVNIFKDYRLMQISEIVRNNVDVNSTDYLQEIIKNLSVTNPRHPLVKFVKLGETAKAGVLDMQKFKAVDAALDNVLSTKYNDRIKKFETFATQYKEKIFEKYPFLKIIGHWSVRNNVPVDHYIKYMQTF